MNVTLSDWEDDEQEEEFAITSLLSDDEEDEVRNYKRGGSRPGKARNKKRCYHARYELLLEQYWKPRSIYTDDDYRTRYRMHKRLYSVVYDGVIETDRYFDFFWPYP
ncbi:unnamed protein product [Aphanomyces euteiches]